MENPLVVRSKTLKEPGLCEPMVKPAQEAHHFDGLLVLLVGVVSIFHIHYLPVVVKLKVLT
jgi:hypothetical protein